MKDVPRDLDAFRLYVREFVEREVVPHAHNWASRRSVPRALHEAAGDAGLFGLKYPRALGGSERPYAFTRVMLEEFACSGYMGCLLSLVLQSEFASPHLALYASPSLQERILRPAIAGRTILSIAMTEPEGGSNLAELRTTATPAEGGYLIRGKKWMIGNASLANAILVVCNSAEKQEGWSRLTMLLVETDRPGFSVDRQLEKIGLHATPNCELSFDDCFVPDENVVGKPGAALPQLVNGNAYERIAMATVALATMRTGWQDALRFLSERRSGGRPLIDHSPWRHLLMDDYMQMEGCERVVRDAVETVENGAPDQEMVLLAKVLATSTCQRVIQHAAQAHGARGFLAETLIGRLAADAQSMTVGGGASEVLIDALSRTVFPRAVRGRK